MSAQSLYTERVFREFLPREESALQVLLYFNIFNHPLTVEEIVSFLPMGIQSVDEITRILESPSLNRIVKRIGRYFFLRTAPDTCVESRLDKEQFAKRRIAIATFVARFIGMFPFVRGVMLSGELSKGIASKNSDIDFVVVTQAKRLWISRTLLILFKKAFLFNSKKYFCLNHFVSEENLAVGLRNIYSATEVATLKPLYSLKKYEEYMAGNRWVKQYFPNWKPVDGCSTECSANDHNQHVTSSRSVTKKVLNKIDHWLMIRWRSLWQHRYPHLSHEELHHKFRCDTTLSTAYGDDYQHKILTQYALQLRQYGIAGPEQRN